jgi:hypothetical protein
MNKAILNITQIEIDTNTNHDIGVKEYKEHNELIVDTNT